MTLVDCTRSRKIIQLKIRAETIRTCFFQSNSTLQIGDGRRIASVMAFSVVPVRFDGGDFDKTSFAISTDVLLQVSGVTQPDSLNCLHVSKGLLPLFMNLLQRIPKTPMHTLKTVCVSTSRPLQIVNVTIRNSILKPCDLQRILLSFYGIFRNLYAQRSLRELL